MLDPRDEIKDRLTIYDLVSSYVELKRAGRNFKGLCPFHSEKSPSFVVSPEKGLAYCFGCNQGGDIFAFYQLVEGVDFPEAINRLAEKVGVDLPKQVDSAVIQKTKGEKLVSVDIHSLAVRAYMQALWEGKDADKLLSYLRGRGLPDALIKKFQLGYAPDNNRFLLQKVLGAGFDQADFVLSGLGVADDASGRDAHDRFRQRLMIPIRNQRGEVIAFGGRALAKDQQPKYLNSPETASYNKSQTLFGFDFAKDEMRKTGQVYVVEGYFDVMAFHIAGFTNVVATCGTALTEKQVALLKRFVDKVIFAFDADNAGREALLRGAEIVLRFGLDVSALFWKDGKDAAEIVKDDPKLWVDVVNNCHYELADYIWQVEFLGKESNEIQKSEFASYVLRKYMPLVKQIDSAVKKDLFVRKLAQYLRTEPKFLYDELEAIRTPSVVRLNEGDNKAVNQFAFEQTITVEEFFWAYIFQRPEMIKDLWPHIQKWQVIFGLNPVYKSLEDAYNSDRNLGEYTMQDLGLPQDVTERFDRISLYLETRQIDVWTQTQLLKEIKLLFQRLITQYREQRMSGLRQDIATAEQDGDKARLHSLLQEYNEFLNAKS